MVYTPTGKPVGRPKTKDYQTISLKIDQALLARVKRYASLHRQTVSELMREGVEWRIGEGDPLGQRYATGDRTAAEYHGNTEIPIGTDSENASVVVLDEIRTALAQQAIQLHALTQVLEQRSVYFGNTIDLPPGQQNASAPTRKDHRRQAPQAVHAESSNTVLQQERHAAARNTSAPQPDVLDKAVLVARLHEMRTRGLSLAQIANQLQAEGVPTLSGKGQWQKGTIDKLLRHQGKR